MKKIIIILTLLLCINLKALEIQTVYIDAESDIAGSLVIKEVLEVDTIDEEFIINIFYKDKTLMEFDKSDESLISSKIYNGSNINVSKVGYIDGEFEMKEIYEEDFTYKLQPIENIEYKDENGYLNITIPTSDKNKIYLEYTILNVLVEHNDCAELYFKFLNNFNYDINRVIIVTKLPFHSNTFKVWAHGDKGNVTIDGESSIVLNEIYNFKKGTYLDNRILFDKELFAINLNESKKSNINALERIETIENTRENNKKTINIIKYILIILSIILIITIILFIIYKKTKNKHNK